MREDRPKRQHYFQEIDNQLANNLLIRKAQGEGPRSLLRALADLLLYNESKHEQMLQESIQYMERCISERKLPHKLHYFYDGTHLLQNFREKPQLAAFDRVHIELLGQKYRCRMCLYQLTPDMYLSAVLINNNYERTVNICRVLAHYDPIYSKFSIDLANEFKEMIVDRLLAWSNKDQAASNMQNACNGHVQLKPVVAKKKHKKSLSVCDKSEFQEMQYIRNSPIDSKQKKTSERMGSNDLLNDDLEEFKLIKECNVNERKGSTSLEKEPSISSKSLNGGYEMSYMPQMYGYLPMLQRHYSQHPTNEYRMIHSERNFSTHSTSPTKVDEPNRRYTGRLKFFDESKNYGFIVMDEDCSDIFVHYDDLEKAHIDKEFMRKTKHSHIIRFEFSCMVYIGKYNRSRKAVDLVLLNSGFMPF